MYCKTKDVILTKKIIKLVGGLGNQMFQYAFAYALGKRFNAKVKLDLSWFEAVKNDNEMTTRIFELDVFNIDYEIATDEDLASVVLSKHHSKINRFLWNKFKVKKFKPTGNSCVEKSAYVFDKTLFEPSEYIYYEGYFQNEKYFKNEREELLKNFNSAIPIDEKNQSVLNKIRETNSISIHVRRGDYVSLECASKFHGTCSLDYYKKAIQKIVKSVDNPHFFLFSDDIDWVIKNLKIEYPFSVVDFNQGKGWLDLNLMKNCKHNILANSSFSWWGAWLNENPQKIVIAPKRWSLKKQKGNIIPRGWIKL